MKKVLFLILTLFSISLFAQKVKIDKGDTSLLENIDNYNIIFDYSNLKIPGYDSEEDFLADKMKKRDEKEEGQGEIFKENWFSEREKIYEPYFIQHFNGYFIMKRKIKVYKNNASAKYTIKVHSKMIYPGYNVGVWWEESKLHARIEVFETSDPTDIIFSTRLIKVQGKSDFNGAIRIANSYGVLARAFAKFLKKKT